MPTLDPASVPKAGSSAAHPLPTAKTRLVAIGRLVDIPAGTTVREDTTCESVPDPSVEHGS